MSQEAVFDVEELLAFEPQTSVIPPPRRPAPLLANTALETAERIFRKVADVTADPKSLFNPRCRLDRAYARFVERNRPHWSLEASPHSHTIALVRPQYVQLFKLGVGNTVVRKGRVSLPLDAHPQWRCTARSPDGRLLTLVDSLQRVFVVNMHHSKLAKAIPSHHKLDNLEVFHTTRQAHVDETLPAVAACFSCSSLHLGQPVFYVLTPQGNVRTYCVEREQTCTYRVASDMVVPGSMLQHVYALIPMVGSLAVLGATPAGSLAVVRLREVVLDNVPGLTTTDTTDTAVITEPFAHLHPHEDGDSSSSSPKSSDQQRDFVVSAVTNERADQAAIALNSGIVVIVALPSFRRTSTVWPSRRLSSHVPARHPLEPYQFDSLGDDIFNMTFMENYLVTSMCSGTVAVFDLDTKSSVFERQPSDSARGPACCAVQALKNKSGDTAMIRCVLLETSLSTKSSSNDSPPLSGALGQLPFKLLYWATQRPQLEPRYATPVTVRHQLLLLCAMTPSQLVQQKLRLGQLGEALEISQRYHLDTDKAYKRLFLANQTDPHAATDYLAKVSDFSFVTKHALRIEDDASLKTCLSRLQALLRLTTQQEADVANSAEADNTTMLRRQARCAALQIYDRLKTLQFLVDQQGVPNDARLVQAFALLDLDSVARGIAAAQKTAALAIMARRHAFVLCDSWIHVLDAIPLTAPHKPIGNLLPRCTADSDEPLAQVPFFKPQPWRDELDWAESEEHVSFELLRPFLADEVCTTLLRDIHRSRQDDASVSLVAITEWCKSRALQLCHVQLDGEAFDLLGMASAKGYSGVDGLLRDIQCFRLLLHRSSSSETGEPLVIETYQEMTHAQRLQRMLNDVTAEDLSAVSMNFITNYVRAYADDETLRDEDEIKSMAQVLAQTFAKFSREPAVVLQALRPLENSAQVGNRVSQLLLAHAGLIIARTMAADSADIVHVVELGKSAAQSAQHAAELQARYDSLDRDLAIHDILEHAGMTLSLARIEQLRDMAKDRPDAHQDLAQLFLTFCSHRATKCSSLADWDQLCRDVEYLRGQWASASLSDTEAYECVVIAALLEPAATTREFLANVLPLSDKAWLIAPTQGQIASEVDNDDDDTGPADSSFSSLRPFGLSRLMKLASPRKSSMPTLEAAPKQPASAGTSVSDVQLKVLSTKSAVRVVLDAMTQALDSAAAFDKVIDFAGSLLGAFKHEGLVQEELDPLLRQVTTAACLRDIGCDLPMLQVRLQPPSKTIQAVLKADPTAYAKLNALTRLCDVLAADEDERASLICTMLEAAAAKATANDDAEVVMAIAKRWFDFDYTSVMKTWDLPRRLCRCAGLTTGDKQQLLSMALTLAPPSELPVLLAQSTSYEMQACSGDDTSTASVQRPSVPELSFGSLWSVLHREASQEVRGASPVDNACPGTSELRDAMSNALATVVDNSDQETTPTAKFLDALRLMYSTAVQKGQQDLSFVCQVLLAPDLRQTVEPDVSDPERLMSRLVHEQHVNATAILMQNLSDTPRNKSAAESLLVAPPAVAVARAQRLERTMPRACDKLKRLFLRLRELDVEIEAARLQGMLMKLEPSGVEPDRFKEDASYRRETIDRLLTSQDDHIFSIVKALAKLYSVPMDHLALVLCKYAFLSGHSPKEARQFLISRGVDKILIDCEQFKGANVARSVIGLLDNSDCSHLLVFLELLSRAENARQGSDSQTHMLTRAPAAEYHDLVKVMIDASVDCDFKDLLLGTNPLTAIQETLNPAVFPRIYKFLDCLQCSEDELKALELFVTLSATPTSDSQTSPSEESAALPNAWLRRWESMQQDVDTLGPSGLQHFAHMCFQSRSDGGEHRFSLHARDHILRRLAKVAKKRASLTTDIDQKTAWHDCLTELHAMQKHLANLQGDLSLGRLKHSFPTIWHQLDKAQSDATGLRRVAKEAVLLGVSKEELHAIIAFGHDVPEFTLSSSDAVLEAVADAVTIDTKERELLSTDVVATKLYHALTLARTMSSDVEANVVQQILSRAQQCNHDMATYFLDVIQHVQQLVPDLNIDLLELRRLKVQSFIEVHVPLEDVAHPSASVWARLLRALGDQASAETAANVFRAFNEGVSKDEFIISNTVLPDVLKRLLSENDVGTVRLLIKAGRHFRRSFQLTQTVIEALAPQLNDLPALHAALLLSAGSTEGHERDQSRSDKLISKLHAPFPAGPDSILVFDLLCDLRLPHLIVETPNFNAFARHVVHLAAKASKSDDATTSSPAKAAVHDLLLHGHKEAASSLAADTMSLNNSLRSLTTMMSLSKHF